MKIIKRDGRIVEYDRNKIYLAITKANKDVTEPERVSNKQIESIIKHIEELNKKRMLVEDIQDFIETELMKIKKYALAKSYIIYRYTRALVRKNNTSDESILSIIKNGNKQETKTNSNNIITNRNLIASEVSKNLAMRILLPEKVVTEHENGSIYFHDMEYFLEPFINTSTINYIDILDDHSPNNLLETCIFLSEIIQIVSSYQINEINLNITKIVKYIKPHDNIKEDIKILFHQLNNLITIKGLPPKVNLYLKIENNFEDKSISLIKEIINNYQNNNSNNINLYYELNEENYINKKYYFLTKEVLRTNNIIIINKRLLQNKKYNQENTFNQGIVSINLIRIALESKGNEEEFFKLLDEKLEIIKEALFAKYHSLLGTTANTSPILWQNGALSRLLPNDKIDKVLKSNSTLSIGYLGLYELNKIMKKDNNYSLKIIKYIKKTCDNWKKETNLNFNLISIYNKEISTYFLKTDQEKYGIIKDITDKEYYNLSYEMKYDNMEAKLIEENKYQNITYNTYSILNINNDIKQILELIYNNIQYVKIIKGEENERRKN